MERKEFDSEFTMQDEPMSTYDSNMVAELGSGPRVLDGVMRPVKFLEKHIQKMAQQVDTLEANVNENVGRSVLTNVRVNRLTKRFDEAEVKRLSPGEDQ